MDGSEYPLILRGAALAAGPWKLGILYWLSVRPVLRYSQLKRQLGNISHRTLSAQLKELEQDGLVIRKEYPQVPPKVEYSLTALGASFRPVLEKLIQWGRENQIAGVEED